MIRLMIGLLGALSLSACKQGLYDRCQVDSDCAGDLICVPSGTGAAPSARICSYSDYAAGSDLSTVD